MWAKGLIPIWFCPGLTVMSPKTILYQPGVTSFPVWSFWSQVKFIDTVSLGETISDCAPGAIDIRVGSSVLPGTTLILGGNASRVKGTNDMFVSEKFAKMGVPGR